MNAMLHNYNMTTTDTAIIPMLVIYYNVNADVSLPTLDNTFCASSLATGSFHYAEAIYANLHASHAVLILYKQLKSLTHNHWQDAKGKLHCHWKETTDHISLTHKPATNDYTLTDHCETSCAPTSDAESMSGHCFQLSQSVALWSASIQNKTVLIPTAENEFYCSLTGSIAEQASVLCFCCKKLLITLDLQQQLPSVIHKDNATCLATTPTRSTPNQWQAAKRVLCHLMGTENYGLTYESLTTDCNVLFGHCDASYASTQDARPISGNCFLFSNNTAVLWTATTQKIVPNSTAEAGYCSLGIAGQNAVFLRELLTTNLQQESPTILYEDNTACLEIANNPVTSKKARHIKVKYHYIRQLIEDKEVEVKYKATNDMLADIFTKPLDLEKHLKFTHLIMNIKN